MITKEEYDKLNYWQQEKYLKRCYVCGVKTNPFIMQEYGGRKFCSDECWNLWQEEHD